MTAKILPFLMKVHYDRLPDHMRESTRRYIEDGLDPGGFLSSIITNNLFEAVNRADDTNTELLKFWVNFFHSFAPAMCWGSREKYEAWLTSGGTNKLYKDQ